MKNNRRITLAALLIIFLTLFGVSFLGHRIKRHFEDNGMRERAEVKVFKRLPTSVIPINYALTIKPDLKELTFSGTQSIDVIVIEETKHILLNSLKLKIISASFSLKNGKILKADKIEISEVNETVSIQFSQNLSLGTGQLNLEFNGLLNNIMEGFYRSKYLSSDGQEERYAAVTDFEATHARRAFPCWDEPALKSTFEVTLIAPENRVTLSNMNVISETPGKDDPKNLKEVKFSKTPLMSTYLLAFIIGEFDYLEQKGSNGVLIRVYTPVGKKDQGLFALNVANKALAYYEEYFNIEYPLPKMDLIAIPDLYAGAMENWGLITFREDMILCESQNTSIGQKQKIVLTIAHELAHQWFGNLVTMEWWTHLWLNEGFASFIEYLCTDDLFKQYSIWSDFVIDKYRKALELDALYNSHPIEVEVSNPSEIGEIFDDITYWKGETVLRMLHNYIGDKNFRKGLNLYLSKYKFKNTITENLWSALEEVSDKPVRDMMRSWTKQKGFPLLSVTSRDTNNNTRVLTITQEKFTANGKIHKTESDLLWIIPISISTEFSYKNTAFDILMDRKTIELEIPNLAKDEWIKLNTNSVGFYRVQYSQEMLNLLINSVSDKSQPPFDRFQIHNDLFAFVKAGRTSTVELLKLMQVFYDEDSYVVWYSINSCLERVDTLLSNTEIQPLFHSFGCKLLANSYSRLGWDPIEGENHLDTLLRSLVIDRLANFRDETVTAEAKRKFWDHFWGKTVIIANLREAVYKAVAIDCDEKTFEAFLKLYRETDLDEEKNRISSALGSVSDTYLIKKVLKFSLSKEVKNHYFVDVIKAVALTTNGRVMAWEFFKEYKDELKNRYGPSFLLSKLVKGVIENFATEKKAQEIETFFAENPFPGVERTVKQSLENVRLNAEWLSRDFNSVHNFLNSQLISQII